jgi:hypothetical protein
MAPVKLQLLGVKDLCVCLVSGIRLASDVITAYLVILHVTAQLYGDSPQVYSLTECLYMGIPHSAISAQVLKQVFMQNDRYYATLNKTETCRQILTRLFNIKRQENTFSGS